MIYASVNPDALPFRVGQPVNMYPQDGFTVVVRDIRPAHPANPILAAFREEDAPHTDHVGYTTDGPYRKVPGSHATFGQYRPTILEHYLIQIEGAERDPVLVNIGLGVTATPDQINHAHKVLTRLANWKEGNR